MSLPKGRPDARGAYERIVEIKQGVHARTQHLKGSCSLGDVPATSLLMFYNSLVPVKAAWIEVSTVPGLQDYSRERDEDPTLDIAAGYTAALAAGDAVGAWLRDNLLSDGAGNYITQTLVAGVGFRPYTYSAEQLSGLIPLLNDLLLVSE
jgi:hypothetical protein